MKSISEAKEFYKIVVGLLSYNRRVAIVLLLYSLLLAGVSILPPLAIKLLFDSLQLRHFSAATKWVIIAIVLLVGADLGGLLNTYLIKIFQSKIVVWLRERFASSLYNTDKILRNKWDTGYVLSRYNETNELNTLLLETVTMLLTQSLVFCVGVVILFLWIPQIGVAVIFFTPLFVYLSLQMKRKLEQKATAFQETEAITNERLGEIVQKWQPSIFQSREVMLDRHRSALYSLYKVFASYQSTSYRYQIVLHSVNGFLLGLYWFIGVKSYFATTLTLGSLASGNTFLNQSMGALLSIVANLGQISFALATYRRVAEFVEAKQVVSPFPLAEKVRTLSFRNVSLQFQENKIINNLSLECKVGEWVVCIGENGTGKTSLLRLAAGLGVPSSGNITVNNSMTIPYFSKDWMKRIVFTEPYPFMIDGTIKENCTFANNNKTVEGIQKIFDSLGYRPFWEELPLKFETKTSSSSDIIISHGQRQLIEWVRWLMFPPRDLYLIDEPLGGVATDVKRRCLEVMREHTRNSIVIITTQESEFQKFADYVLIFRKQYPIWLVDNRKRGKETSVT